MYSEGRTSHIVLPPQVDPSQPTICLVHVRSSRTRLSSYWNFNLWCNTSLKKKTTFGGSFSATGLINVSLKVYQHNTFAFGFKVRHQICFFIAPVHSDQMLMCCFKYAVKSIKSFPWLCPCVSRSLSPTILSAPNKNKFTMMQVQTTLPLSRSPYEHVSRTVCVSHCTHVEFLGLWL